jgi:hypothetical protein
MPLNQVMTERTSEKTSVHSPTGVFFYEPMVEALADAVLLFRQQARAFDPGSIRHNALGFDRLVFKDKVRAFLADKIGMAIA